MNKIFIICSKAFYKDIPPIKEKLEENGWEVFYLIHTKILMLKKNGMLKERRTCQNESEMFKRSRDRIKSMDAVINFKL